MSSNKTNVCDDVSHDDSDSGELNTEEWEVLQRPSPNDNRDKQICSSILQSIGKVPTNNDFTNTPIKEEQIMGRKENIFINVLYDEEQTKNEDNCDENKNFEAKGKDDSHDGDNDDYIFSRNGSDCWSCIEDEEELLRNMGTTSEEIREQVDVGEESIPAAVPGRKEMVFVHILNDKREEHEKANKNVATKEERRIDLKLSEADWSLLQNTNTSSQVDQKETSTFIASNDETNNDKIDNSNWDADFQKDLHEMKETVKSTYMQISNTTQQTANIIIKEVEDEVKKIYNEIDSTFENCTVDQARSFNERHHVTDTVASVGLITFVLSMMLTRGNTRVVTTVASALVASLSFVISENFRPYTLPCHPNNKKDYFPIAEKHYTGRYYNKHIKCD